MKRIYIILLLTAAALSAEGQIARNYSHRHLIPVDENHSTTKYTILNAPVGPQAGFYTIGGPFDNSADLKKLRECLSMMEEAGMTEESFSRMVNNVGTFIKTHENEQVQGNVALGMLYRNIVPTSLRDINKAQQYYQNAVDKIPWDDSISLAQARYLMADCINPSKPKEGIGFMARQLGLATEYNHYYSSGLGDIYTNGWGCYVDYYLAATMYDIAQRFGNETSTFNSYALDYYMSHPAKTAEDTIAAHNYMLFQYNVRITNDYGRARQCAMIAAEQGYAPAFYALAMMYENILPNLTEQQRKENTFYWMRKGADMGYEPCIEGLARIALQYNIDTLKGPVEMDKMSAKECAQKGYALRVRSSEKGGIISLRRLAHDYMQGSPDGYLKKDQEKAYILLSALAFQGDIRAEFDLQELTKDYTPGKRDSARINNKIFELVEKLNKQKDENLDRIYNNKDAAMPTFANHWGEYMYDASKELTQNPLYWSRLMDSYKMAIHCYEDLMKEVSVAPLRYRIMIETYCKKRIKQLEDRMKTF